MTSIETIDIDISLAVAANAPTERLVELMDKLAFVAEQLKPMRKMVEDEMIRRIQEQGENITIDEMEYRITEPPETKCIDKAAAMDEAMSLSGGEFEKMAANFLASEPFRYGAMRQALKDRPGRFEQLFEVTRRPKLESGPPKLRRVNTKFIK